jgi:hypothetical protein
MLSTASCWHLADIDIDPESVRLEGKADVPNWPT